MVDRTSTDVLLEVLGVQKRFGSTQALQDARLTVRLCQAADVLDIGLLDHLIVGDAERYYSFRESGELKPVTW